jgi:hypothetical protein
MGYPTVGEADPGGPGASPQQKCTLNRFFFFQKKKQKTLVASQKIMGYPTLGEADPGGLGACPQ